MDQATRELRRRAKKAQAESELAAKLLAIAQQKERWEEQQAQYARDAKWALDNTKLPKWAVMFIESEAYGQGHSAGKSEVDKLIASMIHEAEDYYQKYAGNVLDKP